MSMAYLAQPEQQQQLEWLDGGTLAILLHGKATDRHLMIGSFDVSEGEAPPYHKHTREDEVFMLIKGTALLWYDDQEMELSEGCNARQRRRVGWPDTSGQSTSDEVVRLELLRPREDPWVLDRPRIEP